MTDARWALPTAVTMERLEEGVVLYDGTTEEVHRLTGPAVDILNAADGATVSEIAGRTGLDEQQVAAYLAELADSAW